MARAAYTTNIVAVDYWDRNTPPSISARGDHCLIGSAGTGVFSGHNNELAISRSGTTWDTFIATTALRGCLLFCKDGAATGFVNRFWGHNGTVIEGTAPAVDTDGTLAANSDTVVPSQRAVKTYVDQIAQGLRWKQAVRVATTAAGTLATSFENGDTIDGVTLATNDRILIKNQASATENGIYTVNASGAPTRALDADVGSELVSAAVFVMAGTANADKAFVCTNDSITLGSTGVTFVLLTSALGALVASNNLSDLGSVSTARTNLSVYSIASVDAALADKVDTAVMVDLDTDGQIVVWDNGQGKFVPIPPPPADDVKYELHAQRNSGSGVTSFTWEV